MTHTHTLSNPQNYSYAQYIEKVNEGGRLIVYNYTISLLAITLRRLSSVYLVEKDENPAKYAGTSNTLSLLFGWWGIPWGPTYTLQGLKQNKKGGVDVTKDVIENIKEEDFNKGIVTIETIYSPFSEPNNIEEKCLRNSIQPFIDNHPVIREVYFAVNINTGDAEPHFVIGIPEEYLETQLEFPQEYIQELKKLLYKNFRKNTDFEFMIVVKEDYLSERLKEKNLVVSRY